MTIEFYPEVNEEIKSLPFKESVRIIRVIELFEKYGFNLTAKHLKKLATGLWELRAGRWRILFGVTEEKGILVNLFLKKTQTTPLKEINKALKRLNLIKI